MAEKPNGPNGQSWKIIAWIIAALATGGGGGTLVGGFNQSRIVEELRELNKAIFPIPRLCADVKDMAIQIKMNSDDIIRLQEAQKKEKP